MSQTQTGVVKWFSNAKGYGFISPNDKSEDLFVHYADIQIEGYKTLGEGQTVCYIPENTTKGLRATNVKSVA